MSEELSRVEDLLANGVEEPVEPMSEVEAILRGENPKPHSRVSDLLLNYNPSDVLIDKTVTENGTYIARNDNADGYSKVEVEVPTPQPVVASKNISVNGTYVAADEQLDGYSSVKVEVPDIPAVLDDITITENGNYTPPSGTDGYDDITVQVPGY